MDDIRWKQRFQNFEKALNKLKKAVNAYEQSSDDELIQMATIQAFEFTFELGWKTIKDYLESNDIIVQFARDAIKEGYQSGIIANGEAWVDMADARNLTSHTYNEEVAKKVVDNIINCFLPEFEQLYSYFKERL